MLAENPDISMAGPTIAAIGVTEMPDNNAVPAIPPASPTSPKVRAVPANDNAPVTSGIEPLTARAIAVPATAPAAPPAKAEEYTLENSLN